jgi:hypothetical protein
MAAPARKISSSPSYESSRAEAAPRPEAAPAPTPQTFQMGIEDLMAELESAICLKRQVQEKIQQVLSRPLLQSDKT